jgi:hypothetical protein
MASIVYKPGITLHGGVVISPKPPGGCSRPAGVFPLGFRGKPSGIRGRGPCHGCLCNVVTGLQSNLL